MPEHIDAIAILIGLGANVVMFAWLLIFNP